MTVTEMIAKVKRLIDDGTASRLATADYEDELFHAAQQVADDLDMHGFWRPGGIQTISVVAGTLAYALSSDFSRVRQAIRTDITNEYLPCTEVNPVDWPVFATAGSAYNEFGGLVFYIGEDSSAKSFNLVGDPGASATIKLYYTQKVTAVTGSSSYTQIPTEHHPLVPLRCAAEIMGMDARPAAAAINGEYAMYLERAKRSLEHRRGSMTIADEENLVSACYW